MSHTTQLTVEERASGLRAWAAGVASTEAALELLIGHGHWLEDENFLRAAAWCPDVEDADLVTLGRDVELDWSLTVDFLANPQPAPLTALAVLRLATSIGSHRQLVNLNDDLAGLDEATVRLVRAAIAHSAGWPEDGVAALVDGRF